jgi:DNA-directed RNA polymerase specialized sigma24 family protein
MSAEELTSIAILELHRKPEWRSKSSNGDPFPFALTVMRRDFLDVVRKAEAKRTVIHENPDIGSWKSQDDNSFTTNDGVQAAEDESNLRFLDRTLRPDPVVKAYFEAVILKGLTKRADIAQEIGVTVQEVTDIQRKLPSKSRVIERGYLARPRRTQKV